MEQSVELISTVKDGVLKTKRVKTSFHRGWRSVFSDGVQTWMMWDWTSEAAARRGHAVVAEMLGGSAEPGLAAPTPRPQQRWAVGIHPATFRCGTAGAVAGTVDVTGRPCIAVAWPDGRSDLWLLSEEGVAWKYTDLGAADSSLPELPKGWKWVSAGVETQLWWGSEERGWIAKVPGTSVWAVVAPRVLHRGRVLPEGTHRDEAEAARALVKWIRP